MRLTGQPLREDSTSTLSDVRTLGSQSLQPLPDRQEKEPTMSTRNRIVSAAVFAVLWTAFMLWWSYPDQGIAHVIILSVIGALLGVLWYFLAGWLNRSKA